MGHLDEEQKDALNKIKVIMSDTLIDNNEKAYQILELITDTGLELKICEKDYGSYKTPYALVVGDIVLLHLKEDSLINQVTIGMFVAAFNFLNLNKKRVNKVNYDILYKTNKTKETENEKEGI